VVLVVLNLVCVPVFITLANVVPNYHKAFLTERDEKVIAQNSSRVAMASLSTLRATYDRDLAAMAAEKNAAKASLDRANEQIKVDDLAAAAAKSQVDLAIEANKRQQTLAGSQQDISKELLSQIDKQRGQIGEKDTEIIALRAAKENAEARSTRDHAAMQLALEQLAASDMKVRELQDKVEKALSGQRVSTVGPSEIVDAAKAPIIGTVTTVTGNLASVNVGKVKGIEKGMVLVIYRSDEYIGRLQVESVELDSAAGVIVDKKHEPKANDKVVSKIPLN